MPDATQEIMRLAQERSRATDLAAATGRFLADWEGMEDSPVLKRRAEETLDAAFDVIKYTTERIKQLKEMT